MNEVTIPLKIQGIAQIKAELRELKGELANATDPEQVAKLSQQAGILSDKIKDANEQVKVFATGSKFEQVSNGLGGIKDSLMSLDFEEAKDKAKVFSNVLGGINPKEISTGFKALTGVIGTMSTAFIKLGATILMNPIFLIAAVIIAVIAAVVGILKYFGILDVVMKVLMAPINAIIDGFYAITDAIGLTSRADDKATAEAVENAKKKQAAIEEELVQYEKMLESKNKSFNAEDKARQQDIELLKAQGKETIKLERIRLDASIKHQSSQLIEAQNELRKLRLLQETGREVLKNLLLQGDLPDFMVKQINEELALYDKNEAKYIQVAEESRTKLNDLIQEKKLLEINYLKSQNENAKKNIANQKENAKTELQTLRTIEDERLKNMIDGEAKELAILEEAHKRKTEDNKLKLDEKVLKQKQFDALEKQSLETFEVDKQKIIDKYDKIEEDKQKLQSAKLKELTQTEHEKLKEAYEAEFKLAEGNVALQTALTNKYNKEKDALDKTILDKKIEENLKLKELTLSEGDFKLLQLKTQYEAEQLLYADNTEMLLALKNKYDKDVDAADQEAAEKVKARDKMLLDFKLNTAMEGLQLVTDITELFGKKNAKQAKTAFNIQKAASIASTSIQTYQAAQSAYASQIIPGDPSSVVRGAIAAGVAIASGLVKVAKIASTKFTESGASSAGASGAGASGASGAGNSATSTTAVAPSVPQLFGAANTGNNITAGGAGGTNMTVTAVVSETEITATQHHINNIQNNSKL